MRYAPSMYGQMQHLYVTAHGRWHTGVWVGESAQFGLRLTFEGSIPARGSIYTPGTNGNASLLTGTQAGANGTLSKAWTCRIGPVGSSDDCGPDQQIDIAEDVRTFLDAIKTYTAPNFRWEQVKLCPIGVTGKAEAYSSTYTFTTPVTGTGSGQLPPQIAAAISLRAPIVGRMGRGRFYLPAISGASDTSGQITTTAASAWRAAAVTLIGNLENPPGVPEYEPVVAIMSAGASLAVRPTQVRTGNRFDTIRSRRQQVPETYTATDLT